MTRKNVNNPLEQLILDNIRRYGWHSTSVGCELDTAIFAYTVGLFRTFRHPELLVFGLSPESSHRIFSSAARLIACGRPLDTDAPNEELLPGRCCICVDVPARQYADIVRSACWYYNGNRFPLYQVVWPSDDGLYPWHPTAPDAFTRAQPVFGRRCKGV